MMTYSKNQAMTGVTSAEENATPKRRKSRTNIWRAMCIVVAIVLEIYVLGQGHIYKMIHTTEQKQNTTAFTQNLFAALAKNPTDTASNSTDAVLILNAEAEEEDKAESSKEIDENKAKVKRDKVKRTELKVLHEARHRKRIADNQKEVNGPAKQQEKNVTLGTRDPSTGDTHFGGAAMCAIQKGGLRYIDEWVDYHIALGFHKIYIYDNSDDFELKIWHERREDNHVEVNHFPGVAKQTAAYAKCGGSIRAKKSHSWIAFFDLDEFLVIRDIQKYPHIMDLLNTVPVDVGGLAVNWKMFLFNRQAKYEPKPVTLRFPGHEPGTNIHIKTMVRTHVYKGSPNPHYVNYSNSSFVTKDSSGNIVKGPFNKAGPSDVVVLFHYHSKSLEEFKERCSRGRADIPKDISNQGIYCKSDEDILSAFSNETIFDDSAWKLLKERVPKYSKFNYTI